MPFEKALEELKRRAEKALEMGGPDKVKRHTGPANGRCRATPAGQLAYEILIF
jgi:hypothetical protein